MTQYPPPPPPPYGGYYPPPPPGYGYPPPQYYMQPPAPQPPATPPVPPEKPKSKSARVWDVLTILFEIALLLALLWYLIGRISTNEDRTWLNRVENARDLRASALSAEEARLAAPRAGSAAASRADVVATRAEFNITLNAILDDQIALEEPREEAGKKSLAAALAAFSTSSKGTLTVPALCDWLLTQWVAGMSPEAVAASAGGLIHLEAPLLERLNTLCDSSAVGLSDWDAADPVISGLTGRRRRALADLLVVVHLHEPAREGPSTITEVVQKSTQNDPGTWATLTAYYVHSALMAEAAGQLNNAPTAATMLKLGLQVLNQDTVAIAAGQRSAGGSMGTIALQIERQLPTPAQIMDRLAAMLIESHIARWQRGQDTSLAEGHSLDRWTGSNGVEVSYVNLLTLCRNLHAIDEKPVTELVSIADADGSLHSMTVSAYLKRLEAAAQAAADARPGPDGDLNFGALNVASAAWRLVRDLRIAQAELHLYRVNCTLIENPKTVASNGRVVLDAEIDPLTGRRYLYQPGSDNNWTLYSDFGALDFEATPNQHHDKELDLQATRKQGVVLH
ncbi:MAG TPA: hypothetical protein VL860_11265 [Planctomycetota bacterium]|nr:hypothetical protein [Planctomycetota bacterium]